MHNQNIQLIVRISLLLIYIILFIIQIIFLILFIRKRKMKHLICSFTTSLISCISAIGIMFYYDSLPGYGPMAGLTYFSEFTYSFLASIMFAGMFLLSIFIYIIHILRNYRKSKNIT